MSYSPLKIGPLTIAAPVVLAPMAGYTDAAMRSLCLEQGCGLAYTEVANAHGLVHGSRQTWHLLDTWPGEHPVVAHIYGADPAVMADAAARVEALGRFVAIDINCGCPVRKIVAKGAGAALIRSPARIEAIVKAVTGAVSMPVTVKTRIGPTPDALNAEDLARAAEQGGAAALAVHARPTSSFHRGPADWKRLAALKRRCSIPLIGNGGVGGAEDVQRMFAECGVDAVMIGRGAIGNPWIFADALALAAGRPRVRPDMAAVRAMIAEHMCRLIELKTLEYKTRRRVTLTVEQAAALHFRGHFHRYLCGFRNWISVRRRLNDMRSCRDILEAVDSVWAEQTDNPPRVRGGLRGEDRHE